MIKFISVEKHRASIWVAIVLFTFSIIQAQSECASSFGWANYDGQSESGAVTGGGTQTPVEVTSFSQLKSAVESSDNKVIHVMNDMGNGYRGTSGDALIFKSNKTVIGVKPGITIKAAFRISGVSNIIVKNLIIRGPGNSNSEQNWDAVTIQEGAKRIWFDHCVVMDGEDGNFDVVKGSDNVTASWCKFTYSADGSHNLSNLVGSSDNESQSHGKLNITYAYCYWENVNSRCPRTRYGKIHVLNSYYNNVGSGAYAGKMSNIRLEGSYFESNVKNPTGLISTNGQAGVFAIDCNRGDTKTDGYNSPFEPPYEYTKYETSRVKQMISEQAGATLTNPTECGETSLFFSRAANANIISSLPVYVSDEISVKLNLKEGDDLSMSLLDLSGRKIAGMSSTGNGTGSSISTLNLNGIALGMYIFNINANGQLITKRIIKN